MDVPPTLQSNGTIPIAHSLTTKQTHGNQSNHVNSNVPNGHIVGVNELQDLEDGTIETISQRVSNGVVHTISNGVQKLANGHTRAPAIGNGLVANGNKPTYSEHI